MKKLKLLVFFFSFILLPNVIYAGCTKDEINYFKRIEDKYRVTYEFNKASMNYDVYLYTYENDLYAFNLSDYQDKINAIYEEDDYVVIQLTNIEPGAMTITIIGATDTCDSTLKKYDINLAPYNYYSEDPLCEGIEEFYLCQTTYDKEIDYDTFVSRVETYKKNRVTTTVKANNKYFDKNIIIEFIQENIFEIIVGTIFTIVIIITIILTAKSIKKRRRLEWLIKINL